jgi:hypothetical protein
MMKRRIYKLKTTFTLLGMEAGDWAIIFGTFVVTLNVFQNTLGSRLALFLSVVCTAIVYFIWHFVKDKVPEKFSAHLFGWLGEPEIYKVVPDTKNVPLVVDFKEVQRLSKKSSDAKKLDAARKTKVVKNPGDKNNLAVRRRDSWL